jgi:hypothetical protein
MADLGAMRIPDVTVVGQLDPAGTCPVCEAEVTEAEAAITVKATPGERHGNVVDLNVSIAAATVTALPCGHVLHQKAGDDDD